MVGTNADSWIITSPDGTKYYFEQVETYTDNDVGVVYRKTAWHLTKIATTQNTEILFTYATQTVATKTVGNVSEYKSDCISGCTDPAIPYTLTISGGKDYQVPLLNEIIFDNGKVSFSYDNTRDDVQDSKLNQVEIFTKDGAIYKSIKKWQLNYDYFNGTDDVSFNIGITGIPANQYYKRLKLKSVVEKAPDGTAVPPYEFSYNNETGEASKASFPGIIMDIITVRSVRHT